MRVETVGDGPAEVAVVGGIHGDEPCGVHAVEQLLADPPAVERAVKFVVANEGAIERGVRYVDEDLNRAFPGDPEGGTHEQKLAAAVADELAGCEVLSLHSTQSYGGLFALVDRLGEFERGVCPHLPVDAVVETGQFSEGRLFEATDRVVEVECGYQGSDAAADNAVAVTEAFLRAAGVLSGEHLTRDRADGTAELPVYRLTKPVPKAAAQAYEVFASNFRRVGAGEAFAAADEEEYVADEPFYPVLMSPYGYEDVFGYAADRIDTLSD
ncbi:MAG: succinylglutamate desuccinylase/aspartoacylase family protein [Halorientalis sp.]